MVSSCGRRRVPEVNGHSCARLRSRVVLPLPDVPGDHQRLTRVEPQVERIDKPRPSRCAHLDVVKLERAVGTRLGGQ